MCCGGGPGVGVSGRYDGGGHRHDGRDVGGRHCSRLQTTRACALVQPLHQTFPLRLFSKILNRIECPTHAPPYTTTQVIGYHRGFWFHTLGQRKGIPLSGGPW